MPKRMVFKVLASTGTQHWGYRMLTVNEAGIDSVTPSILEAGSILKATQLL